MAGEAHCQSDCKAYRETQRSRLRGRDSEVSPSLGSGWRTSVNSTGLIKGGRSSLYVDSSFSTAIISKGVCAPKSRQNTQIFQTETDPSLLPTTSDSSTYPFYFTLCASICVIDVAEGSVYSIHKSSLNIIIKSFDPKITYPEFHPLHFRESLHVFIRRTVRETPGEHDLKNTLADAIATLIG